MRAILITTVLTLSAATGYAQEPAAEGVIELAPTVVTGTPQRPGAFYVLSRTRSEVSADELRTSFVRRVVQSARRAPLSE